MTELQVWLAIALAANYLTPSATFESKDGVAACIFLIAMIMFVAAGLHSLFMTVSVFAAAMWS